MDKDIFKQTTKLLAEEIVAIGKSAIPLSFKNIIDTINRTTEKDCSISYRQLFLEFLHDAATKAIPIKIVYEDNNDIYFYYYESLKDIDEKFDEIVVLYVTKFNTLPFFSDYGVCDAVLRPKKELLKEMQKAIKKGKQMSEDSVLESAWNDHSHIYVDDSLPDSIKLVYYCLHTLNLDAQHYAEPYKSLGPCILDCVYSLQAKYFSVTVPVVNRYAEKYMKGDSHADGYSLIDFINHIQNSGGPTQFAYEVLKNKQVLSKRLKSIVCLELAQKLAENGIETKEQFAATDPAKIEFILRNIKGIGDAAVNYLFMLAGDPNRCKPDVHIHHCIRDAIGHDVTNDECQKLFTEAANILKKDYPNLTVASLDGLVWNHYRVGSKEE